MPFRSHNRMRPINTVKHTVDFQDAVPAGTQVEKSLAIAVDNPDYQAFANQTTTGSHVRSIFLNVQVITSTNAVGAINNCYMYVFGNPGSTIPLASFPPVNEVGTSNLRKMIFHQEMAMLAQENDSIPITLFKGVLKIPKKFSRMGVDDKIAIQVGTPVGGPEIESCIQCIYKEIR